MADVIQFKSADSEEFSLQLREALDRLEAARDALSEDIVQLALLGPWAKWSDEQPVGTIMRFGRDALRQTGDPRIRTLCDACDEIHASLQSLARYRREPSKAPADRSHEGPNHPREV